MTQEEQEMVANHIADFSLSYLMAVAKRSAQSKRRNRTGE
jgi:hypothetical protein